MLLNIHGTGQPLVTKSYLAQNVSVSSAKGKTSDLTLSSF